MTIKEALAQANAQLQKKVDSALTNEVFEKVRDVEVETIDSVVYGVYNPKMYRRRGNYGGMADPYNIEISGGSAANGVLTVVNMTEANPSSVSGNATTGKNLPMLIERGHGYGGNLYDYPGKGSYMKPRPFTERTIENLAGSKAHVTALRNGLVRQGVKVK